jgi:hypothetical protein
MDFSTHNTRRASNIPSMNVQASADRIDVIDVIREQRLREVLGCPPKGTTWLGHIRQKVAECPPLSAGQRKKLAMILASESEAGRFEKTVLSDDVGDRPSEPAREGMKA